MQLTTIAGKSSLAPAIRYAQTRMERLRPYLDHGILKLDNNAGERGTRAVALGRKNYLFSGSEAGGKAARLDGTPYRVNDHTRPGLIGAASEALWDGLASRMAAL